LRGWCNAHVEELREHFERIVAYVAVEAGNGIEWRRGLDPVGEVIDRAVEEREQGTS
jgi:hypothetical protein